MKDKYIKLHPLAFFIYDKYKDELESYSKAINNQIVSYNKGRELITDYMLKNKEEPISQVSSDESEEQLKKKKLRINLRKSIENQLRKFIQYEFITIDDDDNIVFTDQIQLIKEYLEDEYNKLFDNFDKLLFPIKECDLEFFINTMKVSDSHNEIKISIENLQKIKILAYSLDKLNGKGITTKNYNSKVITPYYKFIEKGYDSFSMILDESMPYDKPSHIISQIDTILFKANLNYTQKKDFYETYLNRKQPDTKDTNYLFFEKMRDIYQSLPIGEQYILQVAYDGKLKKEFSKETQSFLQKLEMVSSCKNFIEYITTNPDMWDENTIIDSEREKIIRKFEIKHTKQRIRNLKTQLIKADYIETKINNI